MRFSTVFQSLTLILGLSWANLAATETLPKSSLLPSKKVVVIPVEEQVDFGLYAFLKRATAEALKQKPDIIVYKVNTFGGELHSAFEIVDLLLAIKECSTYVFVEKKAISAGALIALSCNRMAMEQGTTIGDCAPITQSQEGGIVMLGEKIQSPLRAKFRNLAERNGYPSLPSQAMVTADLGVIAAFSKDSTKPILYYSAKQWEALAVDEKKAFAQHKVVAQEGQLLTLTDQEAKQYGFSQGSFPDLESFLKHKNWKTMQTFATTWSEDLARVLGKFAPMLMLLGFGALYLEFKTPGLSIFGILGVLCLSIAFGAKYAVGLANHTELILLIAGVLFFMAEVYLFPGTFILGSIGLVLMIVSLTLSLQSFTLPDPSMPWEMKDMVNNLALTVGMAALAIFVPLLSIRYVLPHLPGKTKVIAETTLRDAHAYEARESIAPGMRGIAKTTLRPSGKVAFDDKTLEVSTRGEFIPVGTPVEVFQVQGSTIIVRPVEKLS